MPRTALKNYIYIRPDLFNISIWSHMEPVWFLPTPVFIVKQIKTQRGNETKKHNKGHRMCHL